MSLATSNCPAWTSLVQNQVRLSVGLQWLDQHGSVLLVTKLHGTDQSLNKSQSRQEEQM
jgi:hypothetical protein